MEETPNRLAVAKDYEDHGNTVRVSGGSDWYGLAWCVTNKLRETRAPVDLSLMGAVPAWQALKALGSVLEDNFDNLSLSVQYVKTPAGDIKKYAVVIRVFAQDYDNISNPVKWKYGEVDSPE